MVAETGNAFGNIHTLLLNVRHYLIPHSMRAVPPSQHCPHGRFTQPCTRTPLGHTSKSPENMSRCCEYGDYSEGQLLSGSGVSPSLPKLPPRVPAFPSVTHLEAEAVPFCPKTSAPVALRLPLAFLSAYFFRLVPHPLQGGGDPGKRRGWIQK